MPILAVNVPGKVPAAVGYTPFIMAVETLLATHRAVGAKHLPRYLGAFAWRFNRRFVLKTIHDTGSTTGRRPWPNADAFRR